MENHWSKISKACEPCRSRKTKCNGQQPCGLCHKHPSYCVYRTKARDRPSARQRAAFDKHDNDRQISRQRSQSMTSESFAARQSPKGNRELYRGITATNTPESGPDSDECAQLFYGPSSNFAFVQQLHQSVLRCGRARPSELREGHSEALDTFVQRPIFFGTLPGSSAVSHESRLMCPTEYISAAQAAECMIGFKAVGQHLAPLFTETELDQMLEDFHPDTRRSRRPLGSQEMALTRAILANGALSTNATSIAKTLYEQAKLAASVLDEAVTLSMIQFGIVLADQQVNMGRPNSAYLHLGAATRRALAMGLNRETGRTTSDGNLLQKRRSTMWCLYFHER